MSDDSTEGKQVWSDELFGAVCLVGYIASWVAQSEICQYIQRGENYNKPYLIVWCNHCVMIFMLPIQAAISYTGITCGREEVSFTAALQQVRPVLGALSCLAIIFAIADWFWYIALGHTSVALGSCVYNSQCVFAYLFSVPLLSESVRVSKVTGVVVAIAGVGVVTAASSGSDIPASEQLYGNLCALLSAVLYALFETLFAKYGSVGDSPTVVNVSTGVLGLVSLLGGWVPLIVVNYLPSSWGGWFYEPFEMPSGREVGLLAANAGLALMFNAFFMLALVFTSPVIVATAGMVAIPACAIADWILHGDDFGLLTFLGFVLIMAGFLLLTLSSYVEAYLCGTKPEPLASTADGTPIRQDAEGVTEAGTVSDGFSGFHSALLSDVE